MQASDQDKELANARMWAANGPGWLKAAQERGATANAAHYAAQIEWARGVLATRGEAISPPPSPAPTAGQAPTSPASPATSTFSAPSVSSTDHGWSDVMTSLNAGEPRQAAASPWDGIVADLNRTQGLTTADAATSTSPTPGAKHGWDTVMAEVVAEADPKGPATSASHGWGAVMNQVNAEAGVGSGPGSFRTEEDFRHAKG